MIPYLNKGAGLYYEHIARYISASYLCKDKVVLDVASGEGYGTSMLCTLGKASSVTGIDISEESVKHARDTYGSKKVRFCVDSALELLTIPDNSVDVVVCFELIEHVKDQKKCLQAIARVLRADGILIMSSPNKYLYPDGNIYHLKELYPKQFMKLLTSTFPHVRPLHQSLHLAQVVQPSLPTQDIVEEPMNYAFAHAYMVPPQEKTEEYLIAVASKKKIQNLPTVITTTKRIDFIDFTKGLIAFEHMYKEQTGVDYRQENEYLRTTLNTITSSKFYKMWQKYCSLRDSLRSRFS